MGRHEDRDAELGPDPADEVEHLVASGRVEAVRRLVEQHQLRVVDERLRELHPLTHPGRVAAHLAVALLEEADVTQRLGGALTGSTARQAVDLRHVRDELGGADLERKAVVLGHVPDPLTDLEPVGRDVEVEHRRRAVVGSSRPSRILMSVLLPAPFAPTSPITPGSSSRSRSSRATMEPYFFVKPRVVISDTACKRSRGEPQRSRLRDRRYDPSAQGGVVQLVRTPACHAGGRGFESRRSRSRNPVSRLGLRRGRPPKRIGP